MTFDDDDYLERLHLWFGHNAVEVKDTVGRHLFSALAPEAFCVSETKYGFLSDWAVLDLYSA